MDGYVGRLPKGKKKVSAQGKGVFLFHSVVKRGIDTYCQKMTKISGQG